MSQTTSPLEQLATQDAYAWVQYLPEGAVSVTSKGQPWWCAPVRHFRNGLKHYSRGGKPGRCLQKKRASTRRFVTWTRR